MFLQTAHNNEGFSSKTCNPYNGEGLWLPPEAASLIYSLADQSLLNQVKELTAKLAKCQEESSAKDVAFMKQGQDLYAIKMENEKLFKELNEYKKGGNGTHFPQFDYILDTRSFKGSNIPWLKQLWDNMFDLTMKKDDNGEYIVKYALFITPVYLTIKDNDILPYPFVGSRNDFVYQWNGNVVERIQDKKRKNQMTLKGNSFTTALNKEPWKNTQPSSWKIYSTNGDVYQDKYSTAYTIRKEIESFPYNL